MCAPPAADLAGVDDGAMGVDHFPVKGERVGAGQQGRRKMVRMSVQIRAHSF